MNSYNEKLRATVVGSQQSHELDCKNLEAKMNAALFTLYYTQGTVMVCTEKLEAAKKLAAFQSKVIAQALNNSNLSNNQLASATQAHQYVSQSITNTAVSASNVQIAVNSIVKLASDIGSIYSIVNAADSDTDIYNGAKQVYEVINKTAHNAELASAIAMDASIYTSEVSSATLLDQAKNTNGLINNLLSICSSNYEAALQTVTSAANELDKAIVNSSLASCNLKTITTELDTAQSIYRTMNEMLNQGLLVDNISETGFTVNFYPITAVFNNERIKSPIIKDYYIIVVKDSKTFTFSISTAENIILNKDGFIKIAATNFEAQYSQQVNFKDNELRDSDGDKIIYGQPYVVFLYATYIQEYKKLLNNFDDYLSASSNTFKLTIAWPKAIVSTKPTAVITKKNKEKTTPAYRLKFHAKQKPLCDKMPEYRCILLPVKKRSGKPDFVFNLAIAQQVQAANYLIAKPDEADNYVVDIGNETTDNFGTQLINGADYLAVVLSTSPASVENTVMFADALSELDVNNKFKF